MNRLFQLFIAGIFLATFSTVLAYPIGTYTQIYALGDSLSDMGNYGPAQASPPCSSWFGVNQPVYAPETDTCAIATNPNAPCGKVWVQYLAQDLGINLTASTTGGTDFAYVGAQYVGANSYFPNSAPIGSMGRTAVAAPQYSDLLALITSGGWISPNALITIWAGSNDIFTFALGNAYNPNLTRIAPAFIRGDVNALSITIAQLAARGAQNFLVVNVPNLSETPEVITSAQFDPSIKTKVDSIVQAYDFSAIGISETLKNLAASYHVRIYLEDSYHFLDYAVDHYTQLGFSSAPPNNWCWLNNNADPSQYIFFNGIHPSSHAHELIAEDVLYCGTTNPSTHTLSNCRLIQG